MGVGHFFHKQARSRGLWKSDVVVRGVQYELKGCAVNEGLRTDGSCGFRPLQTCGISARNASCEYAVCPSRLLSRADTHSYATCEKQWDMNVTLMGTIF